ncbi:DUF4376 domain-containing protein [Bosea sp. 685]|uniref:DUF4376 domain-containing protein n=1 Tax=Bosea sp. 685 TaxID=3080057 RepID=UPI002893739B|nr:DUF4376 domain-containing protein [Bosea sp. 685]WNJ89181.1 DUF4376 domain-containing protein [Bosea sp. 685]
MTRYAHIQDGVVIEVIADDAGVAIEDRFHPDFVEALVSCGDDVLQGWLYDGNSFSAPAPAPPPSKADLTAYAADLRWRKEVGGITVADVPVATDDRSKIMIMGARVAAMVDPSWSTTWHGADGATYPLGATAIIAISDAVQIHVNTGFATFAGVKADIEAGEITTTVEIDEAFAAA